MSIYDTPDDPRRVAGPDELDDDLPEREPIDCMDAYKDLLEAEDAERAQNEVRNSYRGNLTEDCSIAEGMERIRTLSDAILKGGGA
jgi:hypothetical protein